MLAGGDPFDEATMIDDDEAPQLAERPLPGHERSGTDAGRDPRRRRGRARRVRIRIRHRVAVDVLIPPDPPHVKESEPAMPEDLDPSETREWLEALDSVVEFDGADRAAFLLGELHERGPPARGGGARSRRTRPYLNTIPVDRQPSHPR